MMHSMQLYSPYFSQGPDPWSTGFKPKVQERRGERPEDFFYEFLGSNHHGGFPRAEEQGFFLKYPLCNEK